MSASRKLLTLLIAALIIGSGLSIGSKEIALFQEGNPVPLLYSILKLRFSDSEYIPYAKTENRIRYLSPTTKSSQYDVVKELMMTKGWNFKEQMGSGLIFTKDGEDAVVEIRQYSKHYFIWEIQKAYILSVGK